MGVLPSMIFMLVISNSIWVEVRAQSSVEDAYSLVGELYDKASSLEAVGGDVSSIVDGVNQAIALLNQAESASASGDEATSVILTSEADNLLHQLIQEADDLTVQTAQMNMVHQRNALITRSIMLIIVVVVGVYLIISPPSVVIGTDWFGELDEG
jgi:hypothetical protein